MIAYPKFCLTPPIFDSTMPLEIGDEFIVTRGRKNWFYGYKEKVSLVIPVFVVANQERTFHEPDRPKVRGYAPKAALEEVKKTD